ncbi:MAG: reverse transcriptase domain-containing protein [Cyanobacteria bacterium P01_F01_bin.53]
MLEEENENSKLLLYKSCQELKAEFSELKTAQNVARMLEVSYDRLVYHIYKLPNSKKYEQFEVSKKSGGLRTISAPSTSLKIIQRKLSQVLYSTYKPNSPVHGFVPGKNIVTNASQHTNKRFVFNIDLKDFFSSIHFGRVRGIFMARPYELPEKAATVLAQICCFENQLPQGAPTSPVVSNMVCARLDSELKRLAKNLRCTYTRYADDITFSTTLPQFPIALASVEIDEKSSKSTVNLGNRLALIIQDNGFEVNYKKVRLQHQSHHQEVTGITVNKFPNVKRSFIREISSMLYVWEKHDLISAHKRYSEKQAKELGISQEEVPFFSDVIRGKINFLGMVRGKNDDIYLKFLHQYRQLSEEQIVAEE